MPLTGLLPSNRSAPLGAFPVRLVAFLQGWSLFLQELVAVLLGSQTTGAENHLASGIFQLGLYHDLLLGRRDYPHHCAASNQSPGERSSKEGKAPSKQKNTPEIADESSTNKMTDVERADTQ
jgi:hypothetical protein